jgi:hypothetical protein
MAYNACTIITVLPTWFGPNSGPAAVCTYSRAGACKYAFPISAHIISKSLRAAIKKALLTLSLETTDE